MSVVTEKPREFSRLWGMRETPKQKPTKQKQQGLTSSVDAGQRKVVRRF